MSDEKWATAMSGYGLGLVDGSIEQASKDRIAAFGAIRRAAEA